MEWTMSVAHGGRGLEVMFVWIGRVFVVEDNEVMQDELYLYEMSGIAAFDCEKHYLPHRCMRVWHVMRTRNAISLTVQ